MDFTLFTTFFYWIWKGNSGRIFYVLALFYGTRALMQQFVVLPFPDGYYWDYPGFPSLAVPYGRLSDFFYSGHCGFLTVNALEWYVNKKKIMVFITWTICIYMSFVMVGF